MRVRASIQLRRVKEGFGPTMLGSGIRAGRWWLARPRVRDKLRWIDRSSEVEVDCRRRFRTDAVFNILNQLQFWHL